MYYTGYKTFCKKIVFKCVTQDIRPPFGSKLVKQMIHKNMAIYSWVAKDIELAVGVGCIWVCYRCVWVCYKHKGLNYSRSGLYIGVLLKI